MHALSPPQSPWRMARHAAQAVGAYVALLIASLALVLGPPLLLALALPANAATAGPVGADAATAASASMLQWVLGAVALGNFLLALSAWHSARHKAATARLESLESEIRATLGNHATAITRLRAGADQAVTHDHLAEVYRDIKQVAAQINTISGQQNEINSNVRLLLARLVKAD